NVAGLTLPEDPDTLAAESIVVEKGASWERGQDQNVFLAKVDWQVSRRHRLSLRYNHQNFTGQNFENGGPTTALEHTGDSLVNTRALNGSFSSVFSPRLFNEVRAQVVRDREPGLANSADPEATLREGGRTILVIGRNFFSPRETTLERLQVADTLTAIRGAHTFKLGADVNVDRIKNFFPGNFSGSYTFDSLAGFVQDEWKLHKELTLTLGLRYDLQSFAQPPVRNPNPQLLAAGLDTSFLKTDKNNFAPRLGLAWNPNPRTVVRAGYGLFYGRTPAIMVGTAHSNNGINVQTVTFTCALVPHYPAILTELPTRVALPRPTIFVFDRDYKNPEVHQAS